MSRSVAGAIVCWAGILAATSTVGAASPPQATVDFAREIYPLLQRACLECHGPKLQEAGLRLDDREEAFASGTLAAGDPEASELLRRVRLPRGAEGVMPAVGEPLAAEQIKLLERWIAAGAPWPDDFEDPGHWAYQQPVRPLAPSVEDADWVQTPVDRFVLRRIEAEGLKPSPPASPAKRLRRLYLDLIGLPPSPQEVEAFIADPSPQRWEAVVDELLGRPQFGERWARPWLDLARYADSHGFQRDNLREIWAYRDWVIRALNDDMPFDQFTIEQLAGDLLPDASEAQRIATGFHRCAPTNVEAGSLPEETRVEQLIDRVNTTAAVWLGTTMECCQCHDHKYDPFSIEDYYQLLAYFNSTEREADRTDPKKPSSIQFQGPSMPLRDPDRAARRAAVQRDLKDVRQARDARRRELDGDLDDWARDEAARLKDAPQTHPLEVVDFISQGTEDRSERKQLLDYRVKHDARSVKLGQRIAALEKKQKALAPDTTLVMVELDQPRETHLYVRGDYRNPGKVVQPATPESLPPAAPGEPNRLQLARWLVASENPLTARVTVNRWWAELFGTGIVATPEDFGVKGDRPTHPELLDWLAVELMENGWSRKRLLKTIVMSATYQQRSAATPQQRARDDRNRWLARGPSFRMGAEMIRDNALAVSGLLDRQSFGPPVRPYQPAGIWSKVGGTAYQYEVSPGGQKHRRGVYVVLKRGSPYPSFINFDATARLTCTVQRSRTNTPLQALTLLNDRVYVAAAKGLAERVLRERPDASRDEQLAYAFQLCTARTPQPRERQAFQQLFETRLADAGEASERNTSEARQAAAWQSVATVLLNLHETITKD